MNEITGGASLDANVGLILENARVAALLAKEISELRFAYSKPAFPRHWAHGPPTDGAGAKATAKPAAPRPVHVAPKSAYAPAKAEAAAPKQEFALPKQAAEPPRVEYAAPKAGGGGKRGGSSGSGVERTIKPLVFNPDELTSDVSESEAEVWDKKTRRIQAIASSFKPTASVVIPRPKIKVRRGGDVRPLVCVPACL